MQISAATHSGFPLADTEIVIFFGETPRDLVNQVKPFLDGDTKIVAVPRDHGKGKSS
jgi:hypothetical protein